MHYFLSFTSPQKQLLDIRIEFENGIENVADFHISAWRPGRYELQAYSKNIINFKVFDELNQNLYWEKIDKNTWRINNSSKRKLTITYSYYCSQMDAGGSWLDDNQLYINPINCLMYSISSQNLPAFLHFNLPEDYKIASGLQQLNARTLKAENYLHLADSPVFASKNLQYFSFSINEILFNIWIQGNCVPDWYKIESDFRKFINAQIVLFGSFPEKEYHFLFQILPFPHYHGVEHRNSTVITLGPDSGFENPEFYTSILGISSHELFHAWNICKIRPKEMLPYDLSKENYFSTGFIVEGVTTYYGDLMLLRSGVWNLKLYLQQLSENLNHHFSSNARNNVSLVETSIDLWVDGYIKSHPQRKVSIYDKGALVALILDLEIRKATQNAKSLDDVMRTLWVEFGQKSIGYSIEDYKMIVDKLVGKALDKYFEDCIYGSISLERILARNLDYIGLVLQIENPNDLLEQRYGLRLAGIADKWFVSALDISSPAEKALSLKDEIIAINGLTSQQDWQKLYDNQMLNISIIRAGRPLSKNLIADQGNYFPQYSIKQNQKITDQQKQNFEIWTGK